jgi:fluoride exporter
VAERSPRLLAAVAAGGMIGAAARYGVSRLIVVPADGFPWATVVTNLTGAFVLGAFVAVTIERLPPNPYLRPFGATGVLGGYTTFSTFSVEADLLVKDGHVALALVSVVVTLAGGLMAVWLGTVVGYRATKSDRW